MTLSAGILLYRWRHSVPEVFLVHPGGPYFSKKDAGWWTIPKGLPNDGEQMLDAAVREFAEETGKIPTGDFIPLHPIKQKGGKIVHCWAAEDDLDPASIVSNTFEMEWPPRSGKKRAFPEIDKAGWFTMEEAEKMINAMQASFLHELAALTKEK